MINNYAVSRRMDTTGMDGYAVVAEMEWEFRQLIKRAGEAAQKLAELFINALKPVFERAAEIGRQLVIAFMPFIEEQRQQDEYALCSWESEGGSLSGSID